MSNVSDKTKLTTPEAVFLAASSAHQNDSKAKRWSFIQSDLTEALNAWQELEKKQTTISPEEEQLLKIKTIIGQLREKLKNF
jgi:hypothetical protein